MILRMITFAFASNAVSIPLTPTGNLPSVAAALLMLALNFTVTAIANVRPRQLSKVEPLVFDVASPAFA